MDENYAVERQIKKEKLRRQAKRGHFALMRLYKFVRFLFVLFIFYATYRLCHVHLWNISSDVFLTPNNPQVEILGNNIVSREKIINELKNCKIDNMPIYKVNTTQMAKKIEALPPVRRAYIRRFWLPARFVIMVEEVTPAISVSPSENAPEIAAFALSGEMIGHEYLPLKKTTGVVKILTYGTKGDDYEKWDKEKIFNLYNIAYSLKNYSGEDVEYIDLRNPHDAYVKLTSVKIRLGELDSTVYERMKAIHNILPEIKNLNAKVKYVDLAWKESKYIKVE